MRDHEEFRGFDCIADFSLAHSLCPNINKTHCWIDITSSVWPRDALKEDDADTGDRTTGGPHGSGYPARFPAGPLDGVCSQLDMSITQAGLNADGGCARFQPDWGKNGECPRAGGEVSGLSADDYGG